jgi:hypothetical protein
MLTFRHSVILIMFASSLANAQEWSDDVHSCIDGNKTACKASAVAAAASAGGGIYSLLKYRQIKLFDKANEKVLVDFTSHPQAIPADRVSMQLQPVHDGDRVQIHYRLSEAENRTYHINLMESNASSADSSSVSYRTMAMQAMQTTTHQDPIYDSDGKITGYNTRIEGPNYALAASYNSQADQAIREAADYRAKATQARNGGAVPWYPFEETVSSKAGTQAEAASFINSNRTKGGTILNIEDLSAEQFRQEKSMVWKARGGLGVVAVGAAIAVEEALLGKVTQTLQSRSNSLGTQGMLSRKSFGAQ